MRMFEQNHESLSYPYRSARMSYHCCYWRQRILAPTRLRVDNVRTLAPAAVFFLHWKPGHETITKNRDSSSKHNLIFTSFLFLQFILVEYGAMCSGPSMIRLENK